MLGDGTPFYIPLEYKMQALPLETVWHIALGLPPKDLLHLCQTRREYAEICKEDTFWREKVRRDFGVRPKQQPTWKETYQDLMRTRSLTVYFVPSDPEAIPPNFPQHVIEEKGGLEGINNLWRGIIEFLHDAIEDDLKAGIDKATLKREMGFDIDILYPPLHEITLVDTILTPEPDLLTVTYILRFPQGVNPDQWLQEFDKAFDSWARNEEDIWFEQGFSIQL